MFIHLILNIKLKSIFINKRQNLISWQIYAKPCHLSKVTSWSLFLWLYINLIITIITVVFLLIHASTCLLQGFFFTSEHGLTNLLFHYAFMLFRCCELIMLQLACMCSEKSHLCRCRFMVFYIYHYNRTKPLETKAICAAVRCGIFWLSCRPSNLKRTSSKLSDGTSALHRSVLLRNGHESVTIFIDKEGKFITA